MTVELPPWPVDDQALELLWAALHPDPAVHERTSVGDLCQLISELAGSDTEAVESVVDAGEDTLPGLAGMPVHVMRDPQYHPHDIIDALVREVWRLRGRPVPGI